MTLKSEQGCKSSLFDMKKNQEDGPLFSKSVNKVKSLSEMCYGVIAMKLERYPPECLAVFSEMEWERIAKLRHKLTEPKQIAGRKKPTRMSPAISEKFIVELESANAHLAQSSVVDKYVWKDVVDYKFRKGGNSRPLVLMEPWPTLVERLKENGETLLKILASAGEEEKDMSEMLEKCLLCLVQAPMCVPLLTASGVGKAVKKSLKMAKKLDTETSSLNLRAPLKHQIFTKNWKQYKMNESSPRYISAIDQLEKLLNGWRHMATARAGIQSSSTSSDTSPSGALEEYSGRAKNTTIEQHNKDIDLLQTVDSWRKLYWVLKERETQHKHKYGARMREIRDDLKSNRKFVKKVETKTGRKSTMLFQTISTKERLDAKLTGKPIQGSSSSITSMSKANLKIKALRREASHIVSRQGGGALKSASKFGCSVGYASTSKKRPIFAKGQQIALKNGKKMKLPESKAVRNAKNNQKRNGTKNAFSY